MILDVTTSSVALAVQSVVKEKNKVFLASSPATAVLTGEQCSPNFVHWTYDTYMLSKSTGGAMVKTGGVSWYFLTADYAFGKQLQADTAALVQASGGKVLGASAYPFPGTTDFSAFLVQAQASGAKVLGLANAGADAINSIKQAHEFGVNKTMKLVSS
jgi:branched-chain amino acid transport system substrate-binding protein